MMSTMGAKPYHNCQTELIPPKWDQWLMFPTFIVFAVPSFYADTLIIWKMLLMMLFFMLTYVYLIHLLIPMKIHSPAKSHY